VLRSLMIQYLILVVLREALQSSIQSLVSLGATSLISMSPRVPVVGLAMPGVWLANRHQSSLLLVSV